MTRSRASTLVLVLLTGLGLTGWLVRRISDPSPAGPLTGPPPVRQLPPKPGTEPAPAPAPEMPVAEAPDRQVPPFEPTGGAADDLRRIQGIGPKMAAALTGAGLGDYARLAAADEQTLRTAIQDAGLRFAPGLGTWSEQARLLAGGDEAGSGASAAELKGGRRA